MLPATVRRGILTSSTNIGANSLYYNMGVKVLELSPSRTTHLHSSILGKNTCHVSFLVIHFIFKYMCYKVGFEIQICSNGDSHYSFCMKQIHLFHWIFSEIFRPWFIGLQQSGSKDKILEYLNLLKRFLLIYNLLIYNSLCKLTWNSFHTFSFFFSFSLVKRETGAI